MTYPPRREPPPGHAYPVGKLVGFSGRGFVGSLLTEYASPPCGASGTPAEQNVPHNLNRNYYKFRSFPLYITLFFTLKITCFSCAELRNIFTPLSIRKNKIYIQDHIFYFSIYNMVYFCSACSAVPRQTFRYIKTWYIQPYYPDIQTSNTVFARNIRGTLFRTLHFYSGNSSKSSFSSVSRGKIRTTHSVRTPLTRLHFVYFLPLASILLLDFR